ncbi:MAG: hypothetical protein PHI06_14860 [Desulfobulbaceae bacterium]|nr:hypothetical protein [Desulfobulbaceae bacterium]
MILYFDTLLATMVTLPAHTTDPARTSFQFLEDLSTAYWLSEAFFAALELKIFDHLDLKP